MNAEPSQEKPDSQHEVLQKTLSYRAFIQRRWAPFESRHSCSLAEALKQTSIVNEVVDTGGLIGIRRWFTSIFMVSEHHPKTKMVFKSASEIRREEVRHLLNYKSMIHPFCIFCIYYNAIISALALCYLSLIIGKDVDLPLADFSSYMQHKWVKFGFDFLETLRIIINFKIGYMDEEQMVVHLDRRLVAKHYLKTYLIYDLISCIPSYTIFIFYFRVEYTWWRLLKWLSVFRLIHISTINNTIETLTQYWDLPVTIYVGLNIWLMSYAFMQFCTYFIGFMFLPTNLVLVPTTENDITALAANLMIGVTTIGIPHDLQAALSYVFITMASLILQLWMTAKFYVMLQRFLVHMDTGVDHYQQLAGYLRYKALPQYIRNDVYRFYEFRFQKKFYDEFTILSMFSDNLRMEIRQYRLSRAIERIKFIHMIPNEDLVKLAGTLQLLYFCPGDVIFNCRNISSSMYYIQVGRVALHDENGIEICHLEDGAFYGDISVVIPQVHVVTMTAISNCKVLILRHQALLPILNALPQIKENVLEISRNILMSRKKLWVQYVPKDPWNVQAARDNGRDQSNTKMINTKSYMSMKTSKKKFRNMV